jgi:hypothetical protein
MSAVKRIRSSNGLPHFFENDNSTELCVSKADRSTAVRKKKILFGADTNIHRNEVYVKKIIGYEQILLVSDFKI